MKSLASIRNPAVPCSSPWGAFSWPGAGPEAAQRAATRRLPGAGHQGGDQERVRRWTGQRQRRQRRRLRDRKKGNRVTGLTKDDFQLFENGRPVRDHQLLRRQGRQGRGRSRPTRALPAPRRRPVPGRLPAPRRLDRAPAAGGPAAAPGRLHRQLQPPAVQPQPRDARAAGLHRHQAEQGRPDHAGHLRPRAAHPAHLHQRSRPDRRGHAGAREGLGPGRPRTTPTAATCCADRGLASAAEAESYARDLRPVDLQRPVVLDRRARRRSSTRWPACRGARRCSTSATACR